MPPTATHPGEHLADAIGALGITAAQLARDIQVPPIGVRASCMAPAPLLLIRLCASPVILGRALSSGCNLQQHY
jgi:hypothetical protein